MTSEQDVDVSVQVAVAVLPDNYKQSQQRESDLLESVGIGASGNDGSHHYCCTENAANVNACSGSSNSLGQLIVRDVLDSSDETSVATITVPAHSLTHLGGIAMRGVRLFETTTHMVVVVGNCSPSQSSDNKVIVHGNIIWTSYIATNSLPFILVVTLCQLALVIWYRRLMIKNASSRIRLEEWIFGTLVLALCAFTIRSILYLVVSTADSEVVWSRVLSDFASRAKIIASRCLYVMVAMGWGVTTPNLSRTSTSLIFVTGGAYLIASLLLVAEDDTSGGKRPPSLLENLSALITIIFLIWIPAALAMTMRALSASNEHLKLKRFQWMLRVYFLSILLKVVLISLFFWDMIKDGGREFDTMTVTEGDELIYLVIVGCIAYLWRPNPDATLYGYALLDHDELADNDDTKAPGFDLELEEMNERDVEQEDVDFQEKGVVA